MIANIELGMQGWKQPAWVGGMYPTNTSSSGWLAHYASQFSTVEVDDTFYGLPPEPLVRGWRESVEPPFSFAMKVPQQITHEKRFVGGEKLLKRFVDRMLFLDETLGPLLLIAPPGFVPDGESEDVLRRFVERLPTEFSWALELKSASWLNDQTHEMLANRNIARVVGQGRWMRSPEISMLVEQPSADFAYLRWCNTSSSKADADSDGDDSNPVSNWEQHLVRLSGLVGSVYGYFHPRAYGDGLRSLTELQYSIGQRRLDSTVSSD